MPSTPPAYRLLELSDQVLAGPLDGSAAEELAAVLQALDGEKRTLAERLIALAREAARTRHALAHTARLAEVGLAFAELIHELRQPLSGISAFAQLLGPDSPKHELADYRAELLRQCSRMESMVERMRLFLRPDEGEAEERSVDVEAALRTAVSLAPKMPPGIQLEVEFAANLGKARGDAQRLAQVLFNLLANARDAQAAKGPGTVRLRAEHSGSSVIITVADQGVGIAPDFARRLFEPFATTKGEAGTGLGLYICREILRAWGGDIGVLAPPPKPFVTAFAVQLCAEAVPPPATTVLDPLRAELADRVARHRPARRVLLVDGDPSVRRLLRVLLSAQENLAIAEASDGVEALALLATAPAQLLLTERSLSGMTGLDLARRARTEGKAGEIILVTGRPSPDAVVEAIDVGVRSFLCKPFEDAEALRARVRAAVDRDELRQLLDALGGDLRPWARRALEEVGGAARELVQALEILSNRPEGPARVGIVAEQALVAPLALAGFQAEGPWDLARAEAAASAGEVEALVVGEGVEPSAARQAARAVGKARWAPVIVWAQSPGGFPDAVELLDAPVTAVVKRPVEAAALASTTSRAVQARRRELRAEALGVVLAELGIPFL